MIYTEWDKLKEMIVGRVYDPNLFDKAADDIEWMRDNQFRDGLCKILEETNEDLDSLQQLLESYDVKVYRPKNLPLAPEMTKMWKATFPYPAICPRDMHVVYGDQIIACTGGEPDRYNESNYFSQIMLEKVRTENRNYISMPQPLLDSSSKPYEQLEGQILFHAANILKCGKLIVHTTPYMKDIHGRGTWQGLQWLKDNMDPDLQWACIPKCGHADGKMALIKPGLMLIKEPHIVPKELSHWDRIVVPPTKVPDWFYQMQMDKLFYKDKVTDWLKHWIGYVHETPFDINIISLDPNTIVGNDNNDEVREQLNARGVKVVPFNFRHRYFFDSGLHCVTLDLTREGENATYH